MPFTSRCLLPDTSPNPVRFSRERSSSIVGRAGHVEVAHEAGGESLRVQGLVGRVVQQPAAEVLSRPVHSSSLLLANRSYISTMNRLVFRVMGPSGRVSTRNTGFGQHVLVGPLDLHRLAAVGVGLAHAPGPLHQLLLIHVVEGGQLANHVGAGLPATPLDLGEVGAGDAGAPGHVPQAEVSPQPSEQRAYLVIALDCLSVLKVPVVVRLIHDVSLLHP